MSTIGTTVDSGNLPSRPFEGMLSEWTIRIDNQKNSLLNQCRHGFPPQSPYLGFSTPTLCYINKLETREAILEKDEMKLEDSEDCDGKHVWEYSWPASHIIVCADEAELSLYNFIIPLRAYYRSIDELRPIVLLVEKQPSKAFLDCISWFPMVYYLCGTCTSLDDLLRSGILWAHSVIILDRGHATMSEEEHMADSKQLIATETICRLFPAVNVSLELTHARNMRFMNFSLNHKRKIDANPVEEHADAASDGTAELSYLFRGPFASGKAFCSSMLDSLLYQSFVKPYLPKLLRLLLGLQFEPGSGFMGTVQVSEREAKLSYSQMFKILTEFTGEIPLGVYRTDKLETVPKPNNSTHVEVNDAADEKKNKFDFRRHNSKKQGGEYHRGSEKWKKQVGRAKSERDEMNDLIEQRAKSLHIPSEKIHEATYRQGRQQSMTEGTSYVIINPEPNLLLKEGDIIYTIKSINQRREDEALKNEGIS